MCDSIVALIFNAYLKQQQTYCGYDAQLFNPVNVDNDWIKQA